MRSNDEVAGLLSEYADLTAITGGEEFRVRVYERAARSVSGYPLDLATLDERSLRDIPNVGASIAAKIAEYLRTGAIHQLEALRAKVPAGVRRLTEIPGLGPKRAMLVYRELGVQSVDGLAEAIEAGKLAELAGFGPRSEENLRRGIETVRRARGRVRLDVALGLAEQLTATLGAVPGCQRCVYAGSLRRMRDTIGDIDILAISEVPESLMAALAHLPGITHVIASGPTKTSAATSAGIAVDLRVVPPASWGAALQYFTGSRAHNIRVREIAVHRKLKLSEYGLFDVATGGVIASRAEEEIYERLGLPLIPPTLREDAGEIEAAQRGELPVLLTRADLRGDLHCHTDLTDGTASLADMAQAAAALGHSYLAVTDHAPNLFMQRMTHEKMLAQREAVRRLDARHAGLRLLHGVELNIDPDGEVDWPAQILASFDLCLACVHSAFTQPREQMTRRLIRAVENPYVSILGHPSGRLIGKRDPVDADWDAVFAACARSGTAVEVDAFPDRIDARDEHVRMALRHGAKLAVDSDAHAVGHLSNLRYGVGAAQRGWAGPADVINAWPLERLRRFLRPDVG